ncbi:MFS general substrate transporter [Nemania sp. FL0916]|nr:MFS general substrate transporter [Nemania sp. FL0916]
MVKDDDDEHEERGLRFTHTARSRESIDSQAPLLASSSSSASNSSVARHDIDMDEAATTTATAAAETAHAAVDGKKVLRRIDTHIIPLLFATYMFNFMDKAILSSASVFGLRRDTHLHNNQYSWVSSSFYFGFLAATYPAARIVARFPVNRVLGIDALIWGVVVALTATSNTFAGLFASRFALGVCEAVVSPGLVLVTSAWYTRDEIPVRTGLWFAGNSVGGIVSSLLAFAIGRIVDGGDESVDEERGAWRWMFAVLGVLTFGLGALLLAFLPSSINEAKFLNKEERKWARDRVVVSGLGASDHADAKRWRWEQMREALKDPKTWLITAIALLCQIPNGGTQNFANIVITSFGFTSLQSTLVNIPYSLLSAGAIAGSGWVAGRFRSINCILVALVVLPPIVGSALISHRAAIPHGVSLFRYFLLSTGPSALPLLLSLVQANFRGVTKKMTMTALLFLAYCAGNIAGPQLFIEDEAPTYDTAFRGILICYTLVAGFSLLLRTYLQFINRRRQKREGVGGSAGSSGAVGGGKVVDIGPSQTANEALGELRLRPEDYDDVTDWNTFGFRYRL